MAIRIRVHERYNEAFRPKSVKIGNQVWMSENLSVDDGGDGIKTRNGYTFYDWDAAKRVSEDIPGWHLPSRAEFQELVDSAGGRLAAGSALKSVDGWARDVSNTSVAGTDKFGFNAQPTGFMDSNGFLNLPNKATEYWSSDLYEDRRAYALSLGYTTSIITPSNTYGVYGYLPVRLIKD